jgi:hypothetical protein
LDDTPLGGYAGAANKFVKVNAGQTALVYTTI